MACHLAGVTTAVATCGTAFGEDHTRVLRRLLMDQREFRGEVIFTFDGDKAGQNAALKAFEGDQNFVTQTFVAVEPDGLDPCELRTKKGDAAVRELVASRVPLYEFAIRQRARASRPRDQRGADRRARRGGTDHHRDERPCAPAALRRQPRPMAGAERRGDDHAAGRRRGPRRRPPTRSPRRRAGAPPPIELSRGRTARRRPRAGQPEPVGQPRTGAERDVVDCRTAATRRRRTSARRSSSPSSSRRWLGRTSTGCRPRRSSTRCTC